MNKNHILILMASMVWIGTVALGVKLLWNYSNSPGAFEGGLPFWPPDSKIPRDEDWPTLVLFVHPNCTCSRATVAELNKIMARVNGRLHVNVLFVAPKNSDENWREGELWKEAKGIPGVKAMLDEDGVESRRFFARTSGQVNLYDEQGELIFSGGITAARGHHGDSNGKSAVIAFINERKSLLRTTPVFGCSLYRKNDA